MDSILTDTSNIKHKLIDFLESSLHSFDKSNSLIRHELDRIREDYTNVIEKGKNSLYSKRLPRKS